MVSSARVPVSSTTRLRVIQGTPATKPDINGSLLRGYTEREAHRKYRKVFRGDLIDSKDPGYFVRPLTLPPKRRGSRMASVKRLRRMESRLNWWFGWRDSLRYLQMSICRYNPFRSYNDQLRFATVR